MDITVLDWLERTVERIPDKTAFIDESGSLTFREVNEMAKAVGSHLLKYKKERLVDFKIDSESLAKNLNDERFNKIEILIKGIDNKSLMCVGV